MQFAVTEERAKRAVSRFARIQDVVASGYAAGMSKVPDANPLDVLMLTRISVMSGCLIRACDVAEEDVVGFMYLLDDERWVELVQYLIGIHDRIAQTNPEISLPRGEENGA